MRSIYRWFSQYFDRYPFLKQFIKFCCVGGTAAVINFSVLYILVEHFGIWYVYANWCGGVISAIFNFLSNKFWTFRNPAAGTEAYNQALKFVVVIISGVFIVNSSVIYLLTDHAGLNYKISWIFATGVTTFWNFILNRLWTFSGKKSPAKTL